jgi:AraC family cel operon transcriptional repressor
MKLLWENEIRKSTEKYYLLKRQTPTIRPFLSSHTHDYAELFYIERGYCVHEINKKDKNATKGDILFIRPDTVQHCIKEYSKNISLLQIMFQKGSFSFIGDRYISTEWESLWDTEKSTKFHFDPMHQLWFENNFNRLLISDNSLFEIERFLLNLIGLIQDSHPISPIKTSDHWLDRALTAIQEPEIFSQGVQGFVSICNRSPEHVEREVKKRTNQTITEILNQARMGWASYMLIYSDTDIIDIADGCGFNSVSYFYKLFGEYFNQSPSRYRKSLRDQSEMKVKRSFNCFFDKMPDMGIY